MKKGTRLEKVKNLSPEKAKGQGEHSRARHGNGVKRVDSVKQGDKVKEQKEKKNKQSFKEGKAEIRSIQCKGCTKQVMISIFS